MRNYAGNGELCGIMRRTGNCAISHSPHLYVASGTQGPPRQLGHGARLAFLYAELKEKCLLQAHKAELIHQNKAIRDTNLNSHVYVTSYLILSARGNLEVEKLGWR